MSRKPVDPPAALLLRACREMGLLALRDLFIEAALLAGDKDFTAAELVAHASLPGNRRVEIAIEAVCGEVSARKLGKIFAKYEAVDIDCLRVDCVGSDPAGILWRVSAVEPRPDRTDTADAGTVIALPPAKDRRAS